jgi:hypothetical protein
MWVSEMRMTGMAWIAYDGNKCSIQALGQMNAIRKTRLDAAL